MITPSRSVGNSWWTDTTAWRRWQTDSYWGRRPRVQTWDGSASGNAGGECQSPSSYRGSKRTKSYGGGRGVTAHCSRPTCPSSDRWSRRCLRWKEIPRRTWPVGMWTRTSCSRSTGRETRRKRGCPRRGSEAWPSPWDRTTGKGHIVNHQPRGDSQTQLL